MKNARLSVIFAIPLVGLAYLVFSSHPKPSIPTAGATNEAMSADLSDDLVIGEPIVFRNLAVFPVTSKTPKHEDRFITLDEGLRAGTVEIFEKGAVPGNHDRGQPSASDGNDPFAAPWPTSGDAAAPSPPGADPFAAPTPSGNGTIAERPSGVADPFAQPAREGASPDQQNPPTENPIAIEANAVNELMVVNHSDKPLYLMPGEIIIGGSQDRTIGQEYVIAPDHKPVSLDVYCVEHGRWGNRDQQTYANLLAQTTPEGEATAGFSANLSLVVSETTEVANSGKFVGSIGSLNKAGRVAVQKGDGQGKVWEEVALENAKNNVQPLSGTFASNYSEAESLERLAPYLQQLLQPIDETANIVGVIVAVNGEVDSMDVFESTPLFRKLWPKLLKSYALDASNADDSQEPGKLATRSDAQAFLHDVAQAHQEKTDASSQLALSQGENDRVLLFSAHERRNQDVGGPALEGFRAHGMGGMGGGAFGGAIHSSGFAK